MKVYSRQNKRLHKNLHINPTKIEVHYLRVQQGWRDHTRAHSSHGTNQICKIRESSKLIKVQFLWIQWNEKVDLRVFNVYNRHIRNLEFLRLDIKFLVPKESSENGKSVDIKNSIWKLINSNNKSRKHIWAFSWTFTFGQS